MADLKKHADDLNKAAQSLTKPLDPSDYLGKLDEPQPSPPNRLEHSRYQGLRARHWPSRPVAGNAERSVVCVAQRTDSRQHKPKSEPAGGGGRSA